MIILTPLELYQNMHLGNELYLIFFFIMIWLKIIDLLLIYIHYWDNLKFYKSPYFGCGYI